MRVATQMLLALAVSAACGSGHADQVRKGRPAMHADSRFDFLLDPASTHDLHMRHVHDDPATVALVREALRTDSRPNIRVNAIVALDASQHERAMPDFIAALDDPDPAVVSEAAFSVAAWAKDSVAHPPDRAALAQLEHHAAALHSALASSVARVRFNAASALVAIADRSTDLSVLLNDKTSLVRSQGLDLAVARASATGTLTDDDVAKLTHYVVSEPDAENRRRAIAIVMNTVPGKAHALIEAAFERGDVDSSMTDAIEKNNMTFLVPAIIKYVQKEPRASYLLHALVKFNAVCAAKALASLVNDEIAGFDAAQALRELSEHSEWTVAQLAAWASKQDEHATPCEP